MIALPDVSRETQDRFAIYAKLLAKWNPRINLVSTQSVKDMWTRHFSDSAQLHDLADHPISHWADLGSGGGFPGLVIAILAMDRGSPERVSLVESDARKCAFLRTVVRETGAPVSIHTDRIATLPPLNADVLSARALANLDTLLEHAERHLTEGGTALFPKGKSWRKELEQAQTRWCFDHRIATNKVHDGSVILSITGVRRAPPDAP